MPSYSRDLKALIILLIINTLISVIYYLLNKFVFKKNKEQINENGEKERKHSLELRLFIMIVVPIVGPVFFIASWIVFKVFFSEPVDLEDVVFSKDKVKFNVRAEEEKESAGLFAR